MTLKHWFWKGVLFVGLGSMVASLLSCGVQQVRKMTTLAQDGNHTRSDYPRDPGSFCALNPEGCPPDPSTTAPAQPGGFDLGSCLNACEAGGAVLESYCRGLPESWQRRLCWSVVQGSKVACRGMCYRIHTCSTSADCPERKE